MKNILFIFLLFLSACTPIRYVYVDPKDSTIKRQRIVYDDLYLDPLPFRYNNWWLYNPPIYSPTIVIQRKQPIVVNPKRTQTPQTPIRKFEPRKR